MCKDFPENTSEEYFHPTEAEDELYYMFVNSLSK
jgi:hypothetical protein